MSAHSKSAVLSSVTIHVIFFGGLILPVLLGSCSEKKVQQHVFELVSLPSVDFSLPQETPVDQPQPLDDVPLAIPEIVELPDQPVIPDLPPPPPLPAPAQATPAPAPQPVRIDPPPPPKPRVVTIDQFHAEHGAPKVNTRPTPAPRTTPTPPQIDLSQIRRGLQRVAQPSDSSAAAPTRKELEAMAEFERMLTRQIDRAWKKPPDANARGLVAMVEFVVHADGTITNVRVARSSGNSSFDASAVEAVRSARGFGKPPNGQSNTYTIPFMLDERR